jgi:uncharacterized protein
MTISMYQAAVPPTIRSLTNLAAILEKAAAHCEARKIDPAVLVGARLFPDMFPLSRQVQIATDVAKGGAARLAGQDPPAYEDKESTFPELIARVRKTIEFLKSFRSEQLDGTEEKAITLKMRNGERHFQGLPYVQSFVLPNVYFHVTTAYNILRHNGVEIGKQDFLGAD